MKENPHAELDPNAFCPRMVWLIHDDRPGHLSQLDGLGTRIHELSGAEICWLTPEDLRIRRRKQQGQDSPDIIVAAGHRTHRSLFFAARKYRAFSAVLMKPSLPLRLFDAVICPRHDGLKSSNRVLNTIGVINKITPASKRPIHAIQQGSFLIGGTSKHYQWNSEGVIRQILDICQSRPDCAWGLFDSPRTPTDFLSAIGPVKPSNLALHPYSNSNSPAISEWLMQSDQCWVTPDSVSMVYEALTAGCATAVLELEARNRRRPGRIRQGLSGLIETSAIGDWARWKKDQCIPENSLNLWEANRAARWLLDRYHRHQAEKTSHLPPKIPKRAGFKS